MLLEIPQNLQENSCARVPFLIMLSLPDTSERLFLQYHNIGETKIIKDVIIFGSLTQDLIFLF